MTRNEFAAAHAAQEERELEEHLSGQDEDDGMPLEDESPEEEADDFDLYDWAPDWGRF